MDVFCCEVLVLKSVDAGGVRPLKLDDVSFVSFDTCVVLVREVDVELYDVVDALFQVVDALLMIV
jgi:hypothetical protein